MRRRERQCQLGDGLDAVRARDHISARRPVRHAEQIPCESPRSSIGTSTSTAVGRLCRAHHAHTVRIGRSAASTLCLCGAAAPTRCELRNLSREVILVAMSVFLLWAAPADDEGCFFLWQVACPLRSSTSVAIDLRIDWTIDATQDDALHVCADRARRNEYAFSTKWKKLLHTMERACVHIFAQRSRARAHRAIIAAHFSPIMTQAACVGASTISGMIDASATRRPSTPCTRRSEPTTAVRSESGPILHVPAA